MAYGTNSPSGTGGQAALDRFTEMMIERMEQMKSSDWQKGWIGGAGYAGLPQNVGGRNYSGSNSFFLQLQTAAKGYELPVYLTFNQAHNLKAHVLRGEKAFPVVYWDMLVKDKDGKRISSDEYRAMGKEERKGLEAIPFVKSFPVYNVAQTNLSEVQPERMKKLMEKKPFSKISVGDICEDCGMNRKSFYYHFRDKYDLVNWIFYVDFIERMDWSSCRNEWDMLEALCSHFYRERLFYQNALQVEGQNSFREYFCGMLRPVLMLLTQNLVEEGRKKEFYIAFLCEGVLGELVYWLREGSKITPEEFVEDLHDISLGLARKIIAEEAGTQNVIPILQNKEV